MSAGAREWAILATLLLDGALAACAVCWPWAIVLTQGEPQWWLQLLSQAGLVLAILHSGTVRQAFVRTTVFALAWLSATFWWLYVSMHVYGGMPALLSLLAVLALAAALGLYYGIAAGILWYLRSASAARNALLFAALWTMAELARGTWLTGFGWGAMAYAHLSGPLQPWVAVLGAYGVGAVAAWIAAALAQLRTASRRQRLMLVLLLLSGGLLQGVDSTRSAGTISVALLQGNIPQDKKFDSGTGIPQALAWYAQAMQQPQTQLVLAPETAIPLLPQDLPPKYWSELRQGAAQSGATVLTGIPLGDYRLGYTNSVIALAAQKDYAYRYNKHHLVPFGEFIPPLFKWFTRMLHIPLGDFARGDVGQPSLALDGQRIAPNICYEDLFGEELGARFIDARLAPTLFANVSNLGWFGDTIAIDQHLQISRMRAMEFQRPFLRATNTGATVIMDHRGQVLQSLPRLTQGVLRGTVEGRNGITPFAWWVARLGLWPLWLLCLLVLGRACIGRAARR